MSDVTADPADKFETGPAEITKAGFGFVHLGGPRQPIDATETWFVDAAGRIRDGDSGNQQETCSAAQDDVYLSPSVIRRFSLKTGDMVKCTWRPPQRKERFRAAVDVAEVNGEAPTSASSL